MQYLLPLLSVVIGYLIAILLKPKNKRNIKLLLAFSGAFLLSITVMHLLPEVYHSIEESPKTEHIHDHSHDYHDHDHHNHNHDDHNHDHHNHGDIHNHSHDDHDHSGGYRIGLFIMIGILFQIILEFFSKGAEHGHVHGQDKMNSMPWTLFVSLCLHALLEGMPVSHHHDLAIGIAIHHLPIAIILTTFFVNGGLDKKWVLLFMVVFAFMTPLGTLASEKLPFLTQYYTEISAIVIGILFHISSTIIFESSENHKFNFAKISVIVLGVVLAYFV